MRKKRGAKSGERLLEDALDALARALDDSGAPWMIIGGIAIVARGVRRFTTDVDVTVRGDAVRPEELLRVLERHHITPRIEDALSFARANLVLLARHDPTGVDLDISFAWSTFEHEALAACTPTRFGAVHVPMCLPEHLVVFKAIASRAKDLADVEALLALYPTIDIARVRRRVAELSALAEAPEVLVAFDAIAKIKPRTRRSSKAKRATRKGARPRSRKKVSRRR